MTCSPEANQITASKLLKWSLRTLSLSVSLCLTLARSLFFIIFSNPVPSSFLIIFLNLFFPPFHVFTHSLLPLLCLLTLFFSNFSFSLSCSLVSVFISLPLCFFFSLSLSVEAVYLFLPTAFLPRTSAVPHYINRQAALAAKALKTHISSAV